MQSNALVLWKNRPIAEYEEHGPEEQFCELELIPLSGSSIIFRENDNSYLAVINL